MDEVWVLFQTQKLLLSGSEKISDGFLFSTMGTCCICECVIQMPSFFGHSFSLGTAICDWLQSSHPPL